MATPKGGHVTTKSRVPTADDWLTELARLSASNDKGHTSKEWAKMLGVCRDTFLARLGEAMELGWVRRGKRTGSDVEGRRRHDTVYWIEKPRKARA